MCWIWFTLAQNHTYDKTIEYLNNPRMTFTFKWLTVKFKLLNFHIITYNFIIYLMHLIHAWVKQLLGWNRHFEQWKYDLDNFMTIEWSSAKKSLFDNKQKGGGSCSFYNNIFHYSSCFYNEIFQCFICIKISPYGTY